GGLKYIENSCATGVEAGVPTRRERQSNDALLDFVEVDPHRLGRRFGRRSAATPTATRPVACSSRTGLARFLFVAFGCEWRRHIVRKHGEVDAARHLVLIAGHIQTAGGGSEIRTGGE